MRSKLFVPAIRPELFAKVMASRADAISFDLEDAVPLDRKAEGRRHLADFLRMPRDASAHPAVASLQLGLGDLFEDAGIERCDPANANAALFALRMAAAEAGVFPHDSAWGDVADEAGFRTEATMARRLGYLGKNCIHPQQIAAPMKFSRRARRRSPRPAASSKAAAWARRWKWPAISMCCCSTRPARSPTAIGRRLRSMRWPARSHATA